MKFRYLFVAFISGAIITAAIVAPRPSNQKAAQYVCQFEKMAAPGGYSVTESELKKTRSIIIVEREGRVFAFQRSRVSLCLRKEEFDANPDHRPT